MKDRRVISTDEAPQPIGPYEQAVGVNGTYYISGQVALEASSGTMKNENVEAETHQVMKNVGAILEKAGLNYEHLVKCTIFLTDLNSFSKVNEVYGRFFNEMTPARECIEVSKLPKGATVEIAAIAAE
ncbi:MAG: Rid family detoxifying hydrolase [Flavobacteriales bacterium]